MGMTRPELSVIAYSCRRAARDLRVPEPNRRKASRCKPDGHPGHPDMDAAVSRSSHETVRAKRPGLACEQRATRGLTQGRTGSPLRGSQQ